MPTFSVQTEILTVEVVHCRIRLASPAATFFLKFDESFFSLYFPCPFQWKLGHAVPAILEYLHCPLYESYNMLYSTIYWILGNGIHVKMDCTPFDFALSRLRTNSFQIAQPQCQAVWFRPSLVCARVTVGCKGASDSASCSGHLCNCPSLSESEKKGHPSHNLLETNTSLDGMQTDGGRKEVGSWLPDG